MKTKQPFDWYSDAQWPKKDSLRVSASGKGSELGYATVTSLKVIKDTVVKYHVKSMIDVPCGDVNWIFDSYLTDTCHYTLVWTLPLQ